MADRSPDRRERRLVAVVGGTLLVDTIFYTALTPLLPGFVHHLHMSTAAAGLLSACYAIGSLAATLPAGLLAARIGPRDTVVAGLSLVTVATVGFAVADTPALLELARLLEGVGGAGAWAGGLAWLVGGSAPRRRGTVMGQVLAAATAGSLLGPVVGALASAAGREVAFGAVAAVAAAMALVCTRVPSARPGSAGAAGALAGALRDRRVLGTMWLTTLPALISGALSVLGSLRLHRFGAGAGAIGLTFLIAAAIEAGVGPLSGRASDRYGRRAPIGVGLVAVIALLNVFGVTADGVETAAVIVALGVVIESLWAPAMAWLSEVIERRGDSAGLVGALINLAWGGGQIAGSAGGGGLAGATDEATPMRVAAGLALITLVALAARRGPRRARRRGRRPRRAGPAQPSSPSRSAIDSTTREGR